MHPVTIAIDGPAGSGKSTVAKELSRRLGSLYVDTGAMYRAVTWLVLENKVSPDDASSIVRLLQQHPLHLEQSDEGKMEIWIGSRNVTPFLRTPEVSAQVSVVAAHPQVREVLTQLQRHVSEERPVVMDGRDIGTVVLPNADVKVFLVANLQERAKRRSLELQESGFVTERRQVESDLALRDRLDANRDVAPLKAATDAVIVDSTGKSVEDVVLEIMSIVEQKV